MNEWKLSRKCLCCLKDVCLGEGVGKGSSSRQREEYILRNDGKINDERAQRVQQLECPEKRGSPPGNAKELGSGRTVEWVCKIGCEVQNLS